MQLFQEQTIKVTNSLTGKKEVFTPLKEGYVGMYVCGPTVYSNVHLGNCRTFISFDMIFHVYLNLIEYVKPALLDISHLEPSKKPRLDKT